MSDRLWYIYGNSIKYHHFLYQVVYFTMIFTKIYSKNHLIKIYVIIYQNHFSNILDNR